jgi:hypothetical protein
MPKPDPQTFATLEARYASEPDVELPGAGKKAGFGSATLRCRGKIFAMSPDRRSLVVKLPAARVGEIIAAGEGAPYSTGNGKVMKEWVTIPAERSASWAALADEALACSRRASR